MKLLILFVGLAVLPVGCSRHPLAPERQKDLTDISALSLIGDELVLDLGSRSLIQKRGASIDITPWKIDESFRQLLKEGVESRGKEFRPFAVDPLALEKAVGVRESRFQRIVGKRSQALMELLFTTAEREGIRYFFLALPIRSERYPLHKGALGVYCYDRDQKIARASVYFSFEFALWDVSKRKIVFREVVDPGVTEVMTFGDCRIVNEAAEPEKALEDPVKKTLQLLTDALFEKMGWRKP